MEWSEQEKAFHMNELNELLISYVIEEEEYYSLFEMLFSE